MWLSTHLVPVQKWEKDILHRDRYFSGGFSYLNMVDSLQGSLKKSITRTGSPQPSVLLQFCCWKAKPDFFFFFGYLSLSGDRQRSLRAWGLQSLSVSYELSNIQQPDVHGISIHVVPACGIHCCSCHKVVLMGLSMSVGFNRWDIRGVGTNIHAPHHHHHRFIYINPSKGTFNDGNSMGKEEPSDREQVFISWYLWADIDRSNEISAACVVMLLAWKPTSVMLLRSWRDAREVAPFPLTYRTTSRIMVSAKYTETKPARSAGAEEMESSLQDLHPPNRPHDGVINH